MRDIGIPNGLAEVGYGEADVDDLVAGRDPAAAAAGHVTEDAHGARTWRRCSSPRWNTGEVTAGSADLVAELRRRGVTDVDDSTPRPGALLLRRLALPRRAAGRRPAPRDRRAGRDPRRRARHRRAGHHARRRHLDRRQRGRARASSSTPSGTSTGCCRSTPRRGPRSSSRASCTPTCSARPRRTACGSGPDPSTHTRCTIGGMIGNNACGSRALGYGRTVGQRRGARRRLRHRGAGGRRGAARDALADQHLAPRAHRVRAVHPAGQRLLAGAPAARAAAASTGSWSARRAPSAVVREATVRLVEDNAERLLVVLGYPSMAEAADAVPALLAATGGGRWSPARASTRGSSTWSAPGGARCPSCRAGAGWLFVEVVGRGASGPGRDGRGRGGALDHRLVDGRRRGGRALADPRGRRRPGRAQPADAGVLRLGGRRRPARAAGRLAARLRRAAARARPRRRALRPLRRRLRARADRLPVPARATARRGSSATSSPPARSSSATTAARCPASTATAGPGPSCCR